MALTALYSAGFFALGRLAFAGGFYRSAMLGYLAPIIAMMLAAQGVPARRRLTFAAVTAVAFVAFDLAGLSARLGAAPTAAGVGGRPESVLGDAYEALLRVFPLAALAVFIGRRPQALWSRAKRSH